jgi:hypothetical protein
VEPELEPEPEPLLEPRPPPLPLPLPDVTVQLEEMLAFAKRSGSDGISWTHTLSQLA